MPVEGQQAGSRTPRRSLEGIPGPECRNGQADEAELGLAEKSLQSWA